jgi:hypothetical protein
MLQLQGASPLTPIEVKYNIFQTEMFEIGSGVYILQIS